MEASRRSSRRKDRKREVEPNPIVDVMEEQMRSMNVEAKILQVTSEVMQRIVEHVVRMRLMTENMKNQASDDDLQRVEKMEQGLKAFMEAQVERDLVQRQGQGERR